LKFKEIEKLTHIDKTITKSGMSLAIVFSKEDCKKFGIVYGKEIRLDNAEILDS
jgi:predicted Zn-ribbon and HTH transcriptional regulator